MANITLLGASYTDVPAVTLPQTGGGTVTFYENGGTNQDYEDALIALGVQSNLASGINALTTYANGITGQSDTNLSDAVRSLADGYGGSGAECETGTYTPSANELPNISFANSHSRAPDIIVFSDVSTSACATGNTLTSFTYVDISGLLGATLPYTSSASWSKMYGYTRLASNLNGAGGMTTYTRNEVTASGFKPFAGTTSFLCRTGQTYKWTAIWK